MNNISVAVNSNIEYEVEKTNGNHIEMFYSDHGEWSNNIREKLASSITDNGNGVEIKTQNTNLNLEYDELEVLYLTLLLHRKYIGCNLQHDYRFLTDIS